MFERTRPELRSLAAVLALIAIATSGCGGPSPEERFADSVCSTTLRGVQTLSDTWEEVRGTRAAPGPETRSTLALLTEKARLQTKSFGDELKAIRAPDPDDPATVETGWLREIADQANDIMSRSQRRVDNLPKSPTLPQSIKAFQELESDIFNVTFNVTISQKGLTTLAPELKDVFEKSKSCQELKTATNG